MPKLSFVLKRSDSKTPTSIILLYPCVDGRLKHYTGESTLPGDWNSKAQASNNLGVQVQLTRLATAVRDAVTDFKIRNRSMTKADLSAILNTFLKKTGQQQSDLFERMRTIIKDMKSGIRVTPQSKRYAAGSIKAFIFTVQLLEKFDQYMTIENITLDTYSRFITWMQNQSYSTNYIGSQIKNWKTLCKAIGGNAVINSPAFKKIAEETPDVALDELELAAMLRTPLSERETLVRDWFVLDCYTGLRVSDLMLLNRKNISDETLTIANKKTAERVVIPVHPVVRKIMKTYSGFPPKVSDVEMNRVIKKVARKAKIGKTVLFTITKGGKRVDEYLPKWKMISCHTARRSFITNLKSEGVPDSVIMKLTGIKAITTLQRYDKLTADKAAEIAGGHKFFKG